MEINVKVVPSDPNVEDYILNVEYYGGKSIQNYAIEFLQEYIKDEFRYEGINVNIIPRNLDDFKKWVKDISGDNFDAYFDSYIESTIGEHSMYAPLTGKWEDFKGNIDKETENIINDVIKKSKTLEDFVEGLKEVFKTNQVEIVYDEYYENAFDFAQLIVEDVIESLE